MTMRSLASKPAIVTSVARPDTVTTPLSSVMLITSSPLVALMTIVSACRRRPAAGRRCQVDGDMPHVGPGQIVHRDGVRAAQGVEIDGLDVVEVHRDAPTSRVSVTRPPLAEMSMFSSTLAPLNSIVSLPAPPSTVSLPSPGFQTKVSSPAPRLATSLPRPPMTVSLPALPVMVSLPSPPLIVRLTWPAWSAGSVDGVVSGASVDDQRVDAGVDAS